MFEEWPNELMGHWFYIRKWGSFWAAVSATLSEDGIHYYALTKDGVWRGGGPPEQYLFKDRETLVDFITELEGSHQKRQLIHTPLY
jgi:hypothetical protein